MKGYLLKTKDSEFKTSHKGYFSLNYRMDLYNLALKDTAKTDLIQSCNLHTH